MVELIVVIAIIGILAAVLIPTFTGAIESARIAGGTSNARNLSTLLMTEAAYDNTAYLPTDRVWEIAEENNISLESEVGHYSYWYDASTNRVTYAETASMLSGAVDLNAARAAGSYSVEPETLVPDQPQYRYIERSDNPINRVLNVIRGQSLESLDPLKTTSEEPETGVGAVNVDQVLAEAANEINTLLQTAIGALGEFSSLSSHFQNFTTDKCVYFTEYGVIKSSTTTEFSYGVVFYETASLPALSKQQDIKINTPVVVPASVNIISQNAFRGIEADVTVTATVIVEGETGLIGNLDQTAPAGNVINITGEDVYNYLDINFKDSTDNAPGGTWVYYKNGQPVEVSEAQKKTYDPAVGCDYAYVMPAVTLEGGENGSFFDRVEKLTVRSKLVSGGIEFVMVAVDSSYNVYKLSGVGIVTEVGVSYPDYTKRINAEGEQENITAENYNQENTRKLQLLVAEEVRGFSNLADCDVTLSYRTGVATYATMKSPFGFWLTNSIYRKDQAIWATETECVSCKFGDLPGISVMFDDSTHTGTVGEKEFQLTEMQATRIEVRSGDTLIYVRNYAGSETAVE